MLELLKPRWSQINVRCMGVHSKELRADGESEQSICLLIAWEESPFYSDGERAALAWTEVLTLETEGHVPNEGYELARASSPSRSWPT